MRISDWSSDVCSSDLSAAHGLNGHVELSIGSPMERLDSGSTVPPHLRGAIVGLGNFDGFHLGHQAVAGRAIEWARAEGRPAVIATFDPHPVRHFFPYLPPFLLTTLVQRQRLFAAAVDRKSTRLNSRH